MVPRSCFLKWIEKGSPHSHCSKLSFSKQNWWFRSPLVTSCWIWLVERCYYVVETIKKKQIETKPYIKKQQYMFMLDFITVTYVWRSRKKRRWVPAALAAGLEPLSMKTLVKHFNNSATLSHSRHHPELSETVPSNYSEKQTWPCVTSHSWHSLTIPVTVSILPSSKLTWLWKITIFNG